jgi:hypothetical protein
VIRASTSVLAALWDTVVRAWLVAAAWYGLRRPARLRWLASIGHPRRFARAAIVPAGRHFALALAFLPRARRDEATVAFLACKALDAFEDLSADRAAARAGLLAAADYLAGRTARPPRGDGLAATRDADRLEALLAARLPLLRVALEALPGEAVVRCRALIDRIAAGMLGAHADRRCYADGVLGEAVVFAAEVAAPAAPPPRAACRAAGRALQLANDARDAPTVRARAVALYQALPELPIVPRLLRWLVACAGPGTRAAAALVGVTTCAFYLRQVAAMGPAAPPPPAPLRHPIRAALAAAWSPRAYLAAVAAIEDVLRDALAAVAGVAALDAGPDLAAPLAAADPVASAGTLISLAMQLIHEVPADRLDAATEAMTDAPGKAIVLADYLLFAAVEQLTELGPGSVGRVAALLEQLAAPADRAALARSTALAEFAAQIAARGAGEAAPEAAMEAA